MAARLLRDCAGVNDPGDEVYWLFATEGDAALILGDGAGAVRFYSDALTALQRGEDGYAVSSYRQLLRLRGPLGAGLVDPVLKLFEAHPTVGPLLRQEGTRRLPV